MGEILIAYDREAELETLDRLLSSRGHRVRRAVNGAEALEAARSRTPDLIVADVNLPRLDGFALCRRCKQDESLHGIPFIFYTRRYDDPKYERFALELGAERFLSRNVPSTAVVSAVEEVLTQMQAKITATTPLPALDDSTIRRIQAADREQVSETRLRHQLAEASATQQRLEASESRFRQLFNLNPVPMWILDRETQGFIAVNEAALASYGYQRQEFLRLKLPDLSAPALTPGARSRNGHDTSMHRHKDGAFLAMSLVEQALEFDGRQALMVCAFDVTARALAERQLEATVDDYRARIESAVDGYWLVHDDGRILDVNQAYCTMSGYDRNALLGMSTEDIESHATDETTIRLRLAREGRIERYETRHRRHDGSLMDVEVSAGVVKSADGGDTNRAIVLVRDVSARQREINQQIWGHEQLEFLVELFSHAEQFDEKTIGRRVVEQAAEVCSSPLAFLYFVNNERRTLSLMAWRERENDFTVGAHAEPRSWARAGLILEAVSTRECVVSNDLTPKSQGDGLPELRRTLLAPMLASNDTVAILGVANRGSDYSEDDKRRLMALANGVWGVLEIKRAHAETLGSLQRADIVVEQLVQSLLSMLEKHDPHTTGSARRVASLSLAIAREIDLDVERHESLRIAALLHDVGNMVVPATTLGKPGSLSDQETALMRAHALAGWRLLSEIDFGTPVAEIVHQHHERFDGSGYPRAMKGADLLTEAQILAVADTVEAMSARRAHRESLGMEAALEEISRGAGHLYDPHVVAACTRLIRQQGVIFQD